MKKGSSMTNSCHQHGSTTPRKRRARCSLAIGIVVFSALGKAAAVEHSDQPRLTWHPEADSAPRSEKAETAAERHTTVEPPRLAYAFTAFGQEPQTMGLGLVGNVRNSLDSSDEVRAGGGLHLWGSPLKRLTLMAEFERRLLGEEDEVAPSAGLLVVIVGSREDRWAVSGLGRYKAEGFAEIEGEAELGVALSINPGRFHFDTNLVAGGGLEESETDGEFLARVGWDAAPWFRIGADGRVRRRFGGDRVLAGGRSWDAIGGAQALASLGQFFGSLTAGPSTVGVADGMGWSALVVAGGVTP
jgi:hypothetical protein